MTDKQNDCNNKKLSIELRSINHLKIKEKTGNIIKVFVELLSKLVDEENTIKDWMEITSPILEIGGKTVAIIFALGLIAIPLMISGNGLVSAILAIGACIVAIISSF